MWPSPVMNCRDEIAAKMATSACQGLLCNAKDLNDQLGTQCVRGRSNCRYRSDIVNIPPTNVRNRSHMRIWKQNFNWSLRLTLSKPASSVLTINDRCMFSKSSRQNTSKQYSTSSFFNSYLSFSSDAAVRMLNSLPQIAPMVIWKYFLEGVSFCQLGFAFSAT